MGLKKLLENGLRLKSEKLICAGKQKMRYKVHCAYPAVLDELHRTSVL